MRQAIGELVTCSRCVGTWVAAASRGAPQILTPRFGRLLTWTLAAGARERFSPGRVRGAPTTKANTLEAKIGYDAAKPKTGERRKLPKTR